MKIKTATPFLLAALALVSGCSDTKASDLVNSGKDAMGKLEELDLGSLSVDGMKEKVDDLVGSLGTQLESIKDKASAMKVSEKVQPYVDQLGKLKSALGEKMPSLDSLGTIVNDLKSKFSGDEGIMSVLGPLLEKLQGLLR